MPSSPDFAVALDRDALATARHGAAVVVSSPAVFRIDGPGALQCLQGLLTNDLQKPGDHSLVYGALLTPKGMIVVDYWVARTPDAFTMVAPLRGHVASLDLFARQLPPRLARVHDLTGEARVAWLVGEHSFQTLVKAGLGPLPESAGRVTVIDTVRGRLIVALATEVAPFAGLIIGPDAAMTLALDALERAGAERGDESLLEAARIIAGWPALGAEIDERTLPQEVRYDQIGGVSYTKGCYTGQETVARLHFRGHTNRELRGLKWEGPEPLDGRSVSTKGKEIGTIRSTLELDDRTIGLASIRREITIGDVVEAGGRTAVVVALPFGPADLDG
jgi:folate-binding protein YgfZ